MNMTGSLVLYSMSDQLLNLTMSLHQDQQHNYLMI